MFELHTLLKKLASLRDLYIVKMSSSEKALAHFNRVRQVAARYKSMDVNIDRNEMEMVILNGLLSRFESFYSCLDAFGSGERGFGLEYVKSRFAQ